jgi:hypothetical protein
MDYSIMVNSETLTCVRIENEISAALDAASVTVSQFVSPTFIQPNALTTPSKLPVATV